MQSIYLARNIAPCYNTDIGYLLRGGNMIMAIIHATDQSFDENIKEGLVLVDFWAPWCGPCKMIAPVLEELDGEIEGKASIVKVDVDDNQETAGKYGIMSIPTLVLFKDGEIVDKVVGFKPKEALAELISKHA
jgi:thioredoxin 1